MKLEQDRVKVIFRTVEMSAGIPTTPLVFVGAERTGGSDDLERYLTDP